MEGGHMGRTIYRPYPATTCQWERRRFLSL
jgi:hypothetical protein